MDRLELILNIMDTIHNKKISEAEVNEIFMTCADKNTLQEVKSLLDEGY